MVSSSGRHLATVTVVLNSFNDITSLLTDIDSFPAHGVETGMEAAGLFREMTEPSFLFITKLVHTVLTLLDPPNRLLQRKDTDLMTGLSIVAKRAPLDVWYKTWISMLIVDRKLILSCICRVYCGRK